MRFLQLVESIRRNHRSAGRQLSTASNLHFTFAHRGQVLEALTDATAQGRRLPDRWIVPATEGRFTDRTPISKISSVTPSGGET